MSGTFGLKWVKIVQGKIRGVCTAATSSKIGNFSYSHVYGEFLKEYDAKCEIKLCILTFDC